MTIKYFLISAAVALTACRGGAEEAATAPQTETTVTENTSAASETTASQAKTVTTADAVPEEEKYAEVSPDNVFIDYKLIEDYQSTDITSTLGAKAVDFLAKSEYYADTEKQLDLFTGEEFKEFFDEGGNKDIDIDKAFAEMISVK